MEGLALHQHGGHDGDGDGAGVLHLPPDDGDVPSGATMGDIRGYAAWPATVGQRLRQTRNRWSLGRDGELELLRAALGAPQPPFAVLHGSTVRFHTVAHTTADTIDASTDPPTVTGVKVNFDRLRCG